MVLLETPPAVLSFASIVPDSVLHVSSQTIRLSCAFASVENNPRTMNKRIPRKELPVSIFFNYCYLHFYPENTRKHRTRTKIKVFAFFVVLVYFRNAIFLMNRIFYLVYSIMTSGNRKRLKRCPEKASHLTPFPRPYFLKEKMRGLMFSDTQAQSCQRLW